MQRTTIRISIIVCIALMLSAVSCIPVDDLGGYWQNSKPDPELVGHWVITNGESTGFGRDIKFTIDGPDLLVADANPSENQKTPPIRTRTVTIGNDKYLLMDIGGAFEQQNAATPRTEDPNEPNQQQYKAPFKAAIQRYSIDQSVLSIYNLDLEIIDELIKRGYFKGITIEQSNVHMPVISVLDDSAVAFLTEVAKDQSYWKSVHKYNRLQTPEEQDPSFPIEQELIELFGRMTRPEEPEKKEYSNVVVDRFGQPIAGAEVKLYLAIREYVNPYLGIQNGKVKITLVGNTVTDNEGKFSFEVESKIFDPSMQNVLAFVVNKPGFALDWQCIDNYEQFDGNFVLQPPQTITGRIVNYKGVPIQDASISITITREGPNKYHQIGGGPPYQWFQRNSDEQGWFVFDNLPRNAKVVFNVRAKGYYFMVKGKDKKHLISYFDNPDPITVGKLPEINIEMLSPGAIKGTVIDKTSGEPIPFAELTVNINSFNKTYSRCPTLTADADGSFVLEDLKPNRYYMTLSEAFSRKNGIMAPVVLFSTRSGQTVTGNIEAVQTKNVEVTVTNAETGMPVEKANVTVKQTSKNSKIFTVPGQKDLNAFSCNIDNVRTDENGMAILNLANCEYNISANSEGFVIDQGELIQFSDAEPTSLEIAMVPKDTGITRVRFIDHLNKPVPNILPIASADGTFDMPTTDKDGMSYLDSNTRARINESWNMRMKKVVFARHAEKELAGWAQIPEDLSDFEVKLVSAHKISGRCVDQNGNPIEDVRVSVSHDQWVYHTIDQNGDSYYSDPNGYFVIPAIPNFGKYNFSTRKRSYTDYSKHDLLFEKDIDLGDIVLNHGTELVTGIVIDDHNQPIPGATIEASGPEQPTLSKTTTDEDGMFVIKGTIPNKITLIANNEPFHKEASVQTYGNDRNVVIRMNRDFRSCKDVGIRVTVIDGETLKPKPKFKLSLNTEGRSDTISQETDENGEAVFNCGPNLKHVFDKPANAVIYQPTGKGNEIIFKDESIHDVEMVLGRQRNMQLEVLFLDEKGKPVGQQEIKCRMFRGDESYYARSSLTDKDGLANFEYSYQPSFGKPLDCRISASTVGQYYLLAEKRFNLQGPSRQVLQVAPVVTLIGRVLDRNLQPLSRVRLSFASEERRRAFFGRANTDETGRFELPFRYASMPYKLEIKKAGYSRKTVLFNDSNLYNSVIELEDIILEERIKK